LSQPDSFEFALCLLSVEYLVGKYLDAL